MENILFIYNPNSGKRVITSQLDRIIDIFTSEGKLPTLYRLGENNNMSYEEMLRSGHFDGVVVAGGDGSVNSIIRTLINNNIDIPVGLIPTGTCNDFSRSLGMPSDIIKCARLIAQGNTTATDIGFINDGEAIFVNELAGGALVTVSINTDQNFKKMFGPLAYYISGIGELSNIKPFEIKIKTEDAEYNETAIVFLVLNGSDMSGFSNVIREAEMQDGEMDILIFKDKNPIEITDSLFKMISGGEFKDDNVVRIRTKSCVIECDASISTTVDGEVGPAFPMKLDMKKQLVKIYC